MGDIVDVIFNDSSDEEEDADMEDDDDEDLSVLAAIAALTNNQHMRTEPSPRFRYRHVWDYKVKKMDNTPNGWVARVHITKQQFYILYGHLREKLHPDEQKSQNSTSGNEPIIGEVVLAMGLRYLSCGVTPSVAADLYGVSHSYALPLIHKFLDAADDCEALQIQVPQT